MTLTEALNNPVLGAQLRAFATSAVDFLRTISEHNITFGSVSTDKPDYDAPAMDSYKRTYAPPTAEEIQNLNKKMAENIAGEKYVEGFVQALQLVAMVAGAL